MTSSLPPRFDRRWLRTALMLLSLSLLLLALGTAHPDDHSWRLARAGEIHNAVGQLGSHVAAALTLLLGHCQWLVPLWMAWRVVVWWRPHGTLVGGAQHAAFVLMLLALVALVSLLNPVDAVSVGGQLGFTLSEAIGQFFGPLGGGLLLCVLILTLITLIFGVPWLRIMDGLGAGILSVLAHIQARRAEAATSRGATRRAVSEPAVRIPPKPVAAPTPLPPQARPVAPAQPRPEITIVTPPPPPPPTVPVANKQQSLFQPAPGQGVLPDLALLDPPAEKGPQGYSSETLEAMSRLLEMKLKEFNVDATVVAVQPGPVITRFEILPAAGVKVARITNIAKDLARAMAMISVRVVEVIPGKPVVGIEVPNQDREMVRLSEILGSSAFTGKHSPLALGLGKDIAGHPVVADLARMPHLLVAGTTGSGKSVGVNAMILSMLFKAGPDELRLIMIDPKMLELSVYDRIPHLLTPVVTDMKDAANALRWCVAEMERRYKLMSKLGVRNLDGCNRKIKDAAKAGTPITDPLWRPGETALEEQAPELMPMPFIVVVIDEFADMMMIVGKKVEELIARIAQKARAAGIHLILATQRPSVDVITGLIKANVPTRMAFQVSSRIDSRTILDQGGAEMLLGHGDMLFLPPGTSLTERVHGAFVSDEEVHRVCDDWRARGEPVYIDEILEGTVEAQEASGRGGFGGADDIGGDPEQDSLYDEAVAFVLETRRPSISFVQRKFKIGYNRAARLIEAMELAGVVSPMSANGQRDVLAPRHHD